MSKKTLIVSALLVLGAAVRTPAHAQFIVDPTGGTVVFSNASNHDDEVATRTLPLTGVYSFFGTPRTTVSVSTNGNMNFTGTTSTQLFLTNNGVPALHVLWDDLFIYNDTAGASIVEKIAPDDSYYSVTWNHLGVFNGDHSDLNFQAIWFGKPTAIGGFNFLTGDIAFDYGVLTAAFRSGDASVGLNEGSGPFVPLPGDPDGAITDAQKSLLPNFARTNQFILFRANGNNSYDASIATLVPSAVPEPGTLGLLVGLAAPVAGLGLRRRLRRG